MDVLELNRVPLNIGGWRPRLFIFDKVHPISPRLPIPTKRTSAIRRVPLGFICHCVQPKRPQKLHLKPYLETNKRKTLASGPTAPLFSPEALHLHDKGSLQLFNRPYLINTGEPSVLLRGQAGYFPFIIHEEKEKTGEEEERTGERAEE